MNGDRKNATPIETASDSQFNTTLRPTREAFSIGLRQHQLSCVETFGIFTRRVGLHASETQEGHESLVVKPLLGSLRPEGFHNDGDLLLSRRLVQVHERIRPVHVAVIL